MIQEKTIGFTRARRALELPPGRARVLYYLWNALALLLSSLVITVLSLLLGLGQFEITLFFDYFRHSLILLLNWVPVLLLQLFLCGLFGRQWPAYLLTASLVLLASIGSYYKLLYRSEPFVFSDLSILNTALGVASDYSLRLNRRVLFALLSIPLGSGLLLVLARGRMKRGARLLLCCGCAALASLLWIKVYSNDAVYEEKAVSGEHLLAEAWTEMIFSSKGSVYPFLYNIKENFAGPPDDYDAAATAALLDSFTGEGIPEDRRVHLLVFQLESFCDYSRSELNGLSPETYALYHAIEEESCTGTLFVNVVGGGTIDTERAFLTGEPVLENRQSEKLSYVRYFLEQGYTTLTSHPYTGSFYSRTGVNSVLGFQEFWCLENRYGEQIETLSNHWNSDAVVFPAVIEQYRSHAAAGETVFSFTVTTQGHGGYDIDGYDGPVYWNVEGSSPASFSAVNHYLSGLVDTQVQLSSALDALREDPEPVVMLVYGDHRTQFEDVVDFYETSGINIDLRTQEGLMNVYSTRYLIWGNDRARELLGEECFQGEGETVSPCFLMPLLFERLGWKGNAFMQLERTVMERVPVIGTNGYYLLDGSLTDMLPAEDEELLSQLYSACYYLRHAD